MSGIQAGLLWNKTCDKQTSRQVVGLASNCVILSEPSSACFRFTCLAIRLTSPVDWDIYKQGERLRPDKKKTTYDIRNGRQKLDQDFLFNNSMQFVWLVHLCLHGDFGNPCHGGLTSIPRADSLDSHLFQICASEQWWTSSKYSSRRVFGVLSIHYTCRKYTYNYIVHMMYLYISYTHVQYVFTHMHTSFVRFVHSALPENAWKYIVLDSIFFSSA